MPDQATNVPDLPESILLAFRQLIQPFACADLRLSLFPENVLPASTNPAHFKWVSAGVRRLGGAPHRSPERENVASDVPMTLRKKTKPPDESNRFAITSATKVQSSDCKTRRWFAPQRPSPKKNSFRLLHLFR